MEANRSDRPGKDRLLEEYLVLCAQGGSRTALDALVRRFHRRFVGHAWRMLGCRELAEEAVQSAWIEILTGLKGLREERLFVPWCFRIVTRQAGRRIGRIVAERAATDDLVHQAPTAQTPEEPASPGFSRALAQLPPPQRAAIALHYYEGLSIAEIAVALDVPAGTVKTRLLHARLRLKAALEGTEP
jgi:RNA polymerase sigma-70 factor (ECF subfamily)